MESAQGGEMAVMHGVPPASVPLRALPSAALLEGSGHRRDSISVSKTSWSRNPDPSQASSLHQTPLQSNSRLTAQKSHLTSATRPHVTLSPIAGLTIPPRSRVKPSLSVSRRSRKRALLLPSLAQSWPFGTPGKMWTSYPSLRPIGTNNGLSRFSFSDFTLSSLTGLPPIHP